MTQAKPDDEEELIRHAKADPQAFGVLYDRYIDRIYAFAYHQMGDQQLAQDITAATFEKALRGLHQYTSRGFAFSAWLYRIAHNEIVQYYRRTRWFAPFLDRQLDRGHDEVSIEHLIEQHEQNATLLLALARLSFNDRTLLTLRFYENLSSEQVAQIIGCSLPNLYVRLHRAIRRLRVHFDRIENTPEISHQEKIHASQ